MAAVARASRLLARRGQPQTRRAAVASADGAQPAAPASGRRAALAGAALYHASGAAPAKAEGEYTTAANGLQWLDVVVGEGEPAKSGTKIAAHYTGRLASNGYKFDSSYERGKPLVFTVGVRQVIPGWDIGIAGNDDVPPMRAGGKRKLRIPSELGYGARGAGGVIPPNATLDFDVEYLGAR